MVVFAFDIALGSCIKKWYHLSLILLVLVVCVELPLHCSTASPGTINVGYAAFLCLLADAHHKCADTHSESAIELVDLFCSATKYLCALHRRQVQGKRKALKDDAQMHGSNTDLGAA